MADSSVGRPFLGHLPSAITLDEGSINHHRAQVVGISNRLEDLVEQPCLLPAPKSLVDRNPLPEPGRHIPPGRSRADDPQVSLDRQPIVAARSAAIAHLAGKQGLDQLPLLFGQERSCQI